MNRAQEILDEVSAKYVSLETYHDSGRVLYWLGDHDKPNEVKFSTWFLRPDLFRFDWITHHPYEKLHHETNYRVLWSVDGETKLYSDREDSVCEEESLSMGIAGATGVSKGAASVISSLFLPDACYCKITEMRHLSYDRKIVEGKSHSVISGVHPRGFAYAVTVSPDIVIKEIRDDKFTTIFDHVEIDGSMDEKVFRFEPPE